jgi:hypothetical protein
VDHVNFPKLSGPCKPTMLGLAVISKMGSGGHSLAADIFRVAVYIHLLKMLPLHLAAQILRNYLFVKYTEHT